MATEQGVPSWLTENEIWVWETGLSVLLRIYVAPKMSGPVGEPLNHGWYSSLKVPPFEDAVWECEHLHPTREEAHGCAVAEIRKVMH